MTARVEGNKLILEIDLEKGKPSKSGKMILVGGREGRGWRALGENIRWKGRELRANVMVGYYPE